MLATPPRGKFGTGWGRLIEGASTALTLTRIHVQSRTARMEENGLLDRAYRALMTPLPESLLPSLDIAGLLASLRAHGERVAGAMAVPKDLPQMPDEWRRYAVERGLFPPVGGQ